MKKLEKTKKHAREGMAKKSKAAHKKTKKDEACKKSMAHSKSW